MNSIQYRLQTTLGSVYLVASEQGLKGVYFEKMDCPQVFGFDSKLRSSQHLKQAEKQLKEYFLGQRKLFALSLDLNGTEFQKQVWSALLEIPYGSTCSYGEIAEKIENKKASRAVGTANGKNPFCIVIPCHRVIAADGTLGGYSAGLKLKTALLTLEAKHC